jgi:hypothetical protein
MDIMQIDGVVIGQQFFTGRNPFEISIANNTVSLNGAGDRVVIGTNYNNLSGINNFSAVRVYNYSGNTWNQIGQTISGQIPSEYRGVSVSLNESGNRFVAGFPSNLLSGIAQEASVYEFSGNNQWVRLGQVITGAVNAQSTFLTAINSIGDRIIVSSPLSSMYSLQDSLPQDGYAKAYEYKGSRWVDLGETFYGKKNEYCGTSISMNGSGDIIAISYPGADITIQTGKAAAGALKIFKYNELQSDWEQLGKTIYGQKVSGTFGFGGISLNRNGDLLSIGGAELSIVAADINTNQNPFIVFKYQDPDWQQLGYDISGSVTGDNNLSFKAILSASGNRACVVEQIYSNNIFDNIDNRRKVKVFNLFSSNLLTQFNNINSQNYGALDFGAYIYPNNYYGFCSGAVDGVLCVKTGIGSGERIVFISDHDVVSGKTYSASYGEGTYSGVTSYNRQNAIPSGMRISFGSGLAITGFNDYLKQSINLTGTSFYRLYGNKYGNVNSGNVWNGLIPSGTPYSISILSTGGYYNSHTDLVVYNTGISYLYSNNFASGGFASGGIPSSITGELSFIIDNLFLTEYSGYAYGLAASEDSSMGLAFLKATKDIESQKYLLKNLTSTSIETGFVSFA